MATIQVPGRYSGSTVPSDRQRDSSSSVRTSSAGNQRAASAVHNDAESGLAKRRTLG